ncbi:MAG: LPXTG cell wall anchor domain-containing protein [Actinobacteria bacterium]|nr:LPXTG cell wall anchor domain-containing protein [Actinomycetota bacterium]
MTHTTPATVPTVAPSPGIHLVKTGSTPGGNRVGGTVVYVLTATNTGNVTLSNVTISDPMLGGDVTPSATAAWPNGVVGMLAPGQSVIATVSYTITAADGTAGSIVNHATATGNSPHTSTTVSSRVTSSDSATVPTTPAAGSGSGSNSQASGETTGVSGSGVLAETGISGGYLYAAGGAMMLLLLGAVLVVATRRRRDEDPSEA